MYATHKEIGKDNTLSLKEKIRSVTPPFLDELYRHLRAYVRLREIGMALFHRRTIALAIRNRNRPRTARQVVLVSDSPPPRVLKTAFALSHEGWEVILLHKEDLNSDFSKYCSTILRYRNGWEALAFACRYTPIVYHVFASWKFATAYILIKFRPGKIVFDDYDVLGGVHNTHLLWPDARVNVPLERFCLEEADGLCCRSLETQCPKRLLGYHYKGKRILFVDGCFNYPVEQLSETKEKSVYFAGNISPENNFALLIRGLEPFKKLHVYPAPTDKPKDVQAAFALCATGSYEIHRPEKYPELIREISRYVATVLPLDRRSQPFYTEWKYLYCMTNKVFDALDARCIPLLPENMFFSWILARYNAALLTSEFSSAGRQIEKGLLSIRVEEALQKLSVRNNIGRLISFYQHL